ncbi:uncharacterized protein LOC109705809 [Ananas comosus]|uniref:Uncharacterized protein LOC109705809 n=1 Tax=Ananas comosus TaxID=4615 RepID=A0A6P5ELD2_ANACO|nr:uncharacterized protein LOC109705809 [Ananas comosus]
MQRQEARFEQLQEVVERQAAAATAATAVGDRDPPAPSTPTPVEAEGEGIAAVPMAAVPPLTSAPPTASGSATLNTTADEVERERALTALMKFMKFKTPTFERGKVEPSVVESWCFLMDSNKAKRWVDYSRVSKEYLDGVEAFLNFAFENNSIDGKIPCPCQKCVLYYHQIRADAFDHLVVNGIMPGYDSWFYHGETTSSLSPSHGVHLEQKNYKSDDMVGMLHDAFGVHNLAADIDIDCRDSAEPNVDDFGIEQPAEQFSSEWEKFKELLEDADDELYLGCRKFSKLSFILHLYNIKCRFGWSNESVGALLKLLIDVFLEGAKLPSSFNEAKNIIEGLGMKYNKIHACPNDCILFWKEKENDDFCSICGTSRWKNNKKSTLSDAPILKKKKKSIPAKVLRHFPIKPRLQRLFMSSKTSDFMTWHEGGRIKDGILRHSADSEAWKNFDSRYPEFAIDPRNVRLGLATDGFNPYGTMRSNYSIWPIILIPYNFPPWLCMKKPNFILSLLIPGPRGPGNDIDVYLQPLIEELIELWEVGVETYDASCKKTFQMHTAVMWTINDFPAYGNLSGWSTYGSFACL